MKTKKQHGFSLTPKFHKLNINTKDKEIASKQFNNWLNKITNKVISIKVIGISGEVETNDL